MFTKMLFTIIWIGATAVALLVIRQHRIDTVHNIAETHSRISNLEQALWRVRISMQGNLDIVRINEMAARYENKFGVQLIPLYLGDCLRELTLDTNSDTQNNNMIPLPEQNQPDYNTSLIIDLSTVNESTIDIGEGEQVDS